ncbi:2-C-methyl-D-erythritol 4-phosphate cytidylyltransferase [Sphingobacterium chuzhouense]|uniref:2-C-methyl-D-erythritol 4-phosphate cytidylyltransferase n=1 Tax=Sphingobacterium chuzhouense TaxID=1742264 RepID=A0ABR7XRC5_9SPHI|nr:2-C-methyl-D-erythritol 4-phosphate cytidylyltransferase [Sphingobacterium chuzhouense]MBD1421723.1 2-C-methyl-D-erythritol 4-phosphate cytidylyltransferase [Sphingobacterium chuzhouense]
MQNRYAIIVAGGSGSRMKSDLPKQFLLLDGKPVVMHTLERFANTESEIRLILVLHADMFSFWDELCDKHDFQIPHTVITGGETRFQSVLNGIRHIAERQHQFLDNTLIAVHDAARPVITSATIEACFEQTLQHAATVLAVPSTNSIRQGNEVENKALDRKEVWIVQTPQTFQGHILYQAFQQDELPSFTDDASVVEKLGYNIHLIHGDHRNIKITFPEDISIAQFYLKSLNY